MDQQYRQNLYNLYTLCKSLGVNDGISYYLPFETFSDKHGFHYQFYNVMHIISGKHEDNVKVVFKDNISTTVHKNAIVKIYTISEKNVKGNMANMPYPSRRRLATKTEILKEKNRAYVMFKKHKSKNHKSKKHKSKKHKRFDYHSVTYKKPATVFYLPRIDGNDLADDEEWQDGDNQRLPSAGFTWEPLVMIKQNNVHMLMNPITNRVYSLEDNMDDLMVFVSDNKLNKVSSILDVYSAIIYTDMFIHSNCNVKSDYNSKYIPSPDEDVSANILVEFENTIPEVIYRVAVYGERSFMRWIPHLGTITNKKLFRQDNDQNSEKIKKIAEGFLINAYNDPRVYNIHHVLKSNKYVLEGVFNVCFRNFKKSSPIDKTKPRNIYIRVWLYPHESDSDGDQISDTFKMIISEPILIYNE